MLIYLLYAVSLVLILYYLYTKNYNYWESLGVPYEKPYLIFGSFYEIATRKQHLFHKLRDIYNNYKSSPYVGIYIFNRPSLVIRSPEVLKKVLVRDFDKFANRNVAANEKVDPIAFHTLFSAQDKTWKSLRAKISPVFTSGKMKMMLPLMDECAENLRDYLNQHIGEVVEFRTLTKKYAVDIISSCAFGINSNCIKMGDDSVIFQKAKRLLDFDSFKRSFSVFAFFFAPKLVDIFRLTFVDTDASNYMFNVFTNTLNERKKQKIVRNDLIDLLGKLKETETVTDDYIFDDVKMASQAISFFSAGNDTTSITLSFALYELALYPEIQSRLRNEIREIFDKHGSFTYEALQEMKYLDMVINETLRKYPLTIFLNRKSLDNYTFEETGLTIEKGVDILIPVSGLHYDPEFYPDPEKFDPERFNEENKNNVIPYTYLPFGEGPRNCIGQRFALLVLKAALAHVIKDLAVEVAKETNVPVKFKTAALFLQDEGGIQLKVNKA